MSKRWRLLARWATILTGGIAAGNQLLYAANAWSDWHRWAVEDPSAADLYETNFWIGLSSAVGIVAITWFVTRLLRPGPADSHVHKR